MVAPEGRGVIVKALEVRHQDRREVGTVGIKGMEAVEKVGR